MECQTWKNYFLSQIYKCTVQILQLNNINLKISIKRQWIHIDTLEDVAIHSFDLFIWGGSATITEFTRNEIYKID
jgi:hypothetical protein